MLCLNFPTNERLAILGRMTTKTHLLRFIANALQDQKREIWISGKSLNEKGDKDRI